MRETDEPHRIVADVLTTAGVSEARFTCEVDVDPPHAITKLLATTRSIPCPPLPDRFDGYDPPFDLTTPEHPSRLVVLTGIPGTGKSAIADALGRATGVPVFSFDWLLGAISPRLPPGIDPPTLGAMGYELLATLALRQLATGQSAILDSPTDNSEVRGRLESLANRFGARLLVVECVCGDVDVHRKRVKGRMRHIPGWGQSVPWNDRLRTRRATFEHWDAATLVLDAVQPLHVNVDRAIAFVAYG